MNGTVSRLALPIIAVLAAACVGAEPNDESTAETAQAAISDGPFASVAALVSYWEANPSSSCLNVYVNGTNVYSQTTGFGPCYAAEYFQCQGGALQTHCYDVQRGDSTKSELIAQVGTNPTVTLDGQPYQTGTTGYINLKTCYGDQNVRYFVDTGSCSGNNGAVFGPCYPGRSCY